MAANEKKILSKFEWFLLIVSLGILAMVLLQNQGVNMIETTEQVKISKEIQRVEKPAPITVVPASPDARKSSSKPKKRNEHLTDLSDYFAKNRAQAKAEGKEVGFDWAGLLLPQDEKDYLQKKHGERGAQTSSTDWMALISQSHKTYKSVKSVFSGLGVDADKIMTAENASRIMSNPIMANSIYNKIEEDFGIPVAKSRSFAERNQQSLEEWASFVEKEIE